MNMPTRTFVHGLLRNELADICKELRQPAYRSRQIWTWLYTHRVDAWDAMTNLPADLRALLGDRLDCRPAELESVAADAGKAGKLLIRLQDGECIESVVIPARSRNTVCVSTQVGCRHHCAFCASGQSGFTRNLVAAEIVFQFLLAWRNCGEKPSHVVLMGIGEPFDNYDHALRAARIMNDDEGLNIGARRITVSTCGLIPGIERLADEQFQVELSVSLHAPDDETRSRLMPVNRKYGVDSLLEACRRYTAATNRIVTFEYTLVRNVNDTPDHAERLARRLKPFPCRVNLIPLSPVSEYDGTASSPEAIRAFAAILQESGINTTIRASKGSELSAACGQLRASRAG